MGAQYNSRGPARSRNGDRKPGVSSDYDPLLPVQYYERVVGGRAPSGELKLFFAILEDALRCYVRTKNCRSGAKRAEFVDARIWFDTRGTPHVFSFESVCAFLGLDPNWLRRRLESLGPADLPSKQFRTHRRLPIDHQRIKIKEDPFRHNRPLCRPTATRHPAAIPRHRRVPFAKAIKPIGMTAKPRVRSKVMRKRKGRAKKAS